MKHNRRMPQYNPATDSTLSVWIDPSDSSTSSLLNTSGGAITNGATIGTVKSKKGTARSFVQVGTQPRPTWDSSGINGHPAILSNVQVLMTQDGMSEFNSLTGFTVMGVHKVHSQRSLSGGLDCIFSTSQVDSSDGIIRRSQIYLASRSDAVSRVGGRRTTSDLFQYIPSTIVPNPNGSVVTGVWDFTNGLASSYEGGIRDHINQTFQTPGSCASTEPHYMSIGAIALQVGGVPNDYGDSCNSWIGEILVWKTVKTPDDLVAPHYYLRTKWSLYL